MSQSPAKHRLLSSPTTIAQSFACTRPSVPDLAPICKADPSSGQRFSPSSYSCNSTPCACAKAITSDSRAASLKALVTGAKTSAPSRFVTMSTRRGVGHAAGKQLQGGSAQSADLSGHSSQQSTKTQVGRKKANAALPADKVVNDNRFLVLASSYSWLKLYELLKVVQN